MLRLDVRWYWKVVIFLLTVRFPNRKEPSNEDFFSILKESRLFQREILSSVLDDITSEAS